MDQNVSVRLYRLSRPDEAAPRISDVLKMIGNLSHADRERKLGTSLDVRLELIEEENSHIICGEMTRIQSTNLPSEISSTSRTSLSLNSRLGHSVVFRVNHHLGLLGFQYDKRTCAPARFFQYLTEFVPAAKYNVEPILRDDMWERFDRSRPRKLQIAVASPSDLSVVEGEASTVLSAIRQMGEAYDAPKVSIELSMGHASGGLSSRVKDLVKKLIAANDRDDIDLTKLKAMGSADGLYDSDVDFLGEMLAFTETLELHARDPDINYELKIQYLKRVMASRGTAP
ncbi:hypothetical protein ACLBXM_19850 [Xanthobacteraceae bacterium A53D]